MTTRERAKRVPEPAKRKRRQGERGKRVAAEAGEPATKEEEEQGFLFDPYWDDVFAAYFDPTLRVCCLLRY